VSNFTLDSEAVGDTAVEGSGHYHVYLDGVYQNASAGAGLWLYHVPEGAHALEVRLADNDHTERNAVAYTSFSVDAGSPDVTLDSPVSGEVVTSDFYVTVTPTNYVLSANVEGANVAGEGHYHVFVDGAYATYSTDTTVIVNGIDPGEHEVYVELVNNDHSSLADPVYSETTTITVE
jgi:hypothetical protein